MYNNEIYISVDSNNLGKNISDDKYFFNLGYPNNGYLGIHPTNSYKLAGLNFDVDANDYTEYFTFNDYNQVQNVDFDIPTQVTVVGELRLEWANNIFLAGAEDLKFSPRVSGNTFLNNASSLKMGIACYFNLFTDKVSNMTELTHFRYNWVGNYMNQVSISQEFSQNVCIGAGYPSEPFGWSLLSGTCISSFFKGSIGNINMGSGSFSVYKNLKYSTIEGGTWYNRIYNLSNSYIGASSMGNEIDNAAGLNLSSGTSALQLPQNTKNLTTSPMVTGVDLTSMDFAAIGGDITTSYKDLKALPKDKVKFSYLLENGTEEFQLLDRRKTGSSVTAPTFNLSTLKYTIPTHTAVLYYINNIEVPAGVYQVTEGSFILIEAREKVGFKVYKHAIRVWKFEYPEIQ